MDARQFQAHFIQQLQRFEPRRLRVFGFGLGFGSRLRVLQSAQIERTVFDIPRHAAGLFFAEHQFMGTDAYYVADNTNMVKRPTT